MVFTQNVPLLTCCAQKRNNNVIEDDNAFLIDVKKEKALAKDPDYSRKLPLFIAEKDEKKLYVAPIRGKGLWDAIWAYVSMDENMTIQGIYFDHKAETPGLGAEINQALLRSFLVLHYS